MGTEKPYNFVLRIMCYDAKVHKVEISLAFNCMVKYICLKIQIIVYSEIL